MEKARCNTELYSNLRGPLNNVKPSNFWGSHHLAARTFCNYLSVRTLQSVLVVLRSHLREEENILNCRGVGHEHCQTVDSHTET